MDSSVPLAVSLLVASIFILWKGADAFVDGASAIARRAGISDLVIGLTLVALGTSAPEFAVSIGAAFVGKSDISVSNVVGSNVINLGLVLGSCALIRPLATSKKVVYRDASLLVLATLVLAGLVRDGTLSRTEGIGFVMALSAYLVALFVMKEEPEGTELPDDAAPMPLWKATVLFLVGLAAVAGGSRLLVMGAVTVAQALGFNDWQIGLTVVAAGTSAPEFFASLRAVSKGKFGMGVGALVGSNLFNLLGVLGLAATIHPLSVSGAAFDSTLVLAGMMAMVWVFMRSGWRVGWFEGGILVAFNLVRWWMEVDEGAPSLRDWLGLS